jgi:hypothetical protein
MRFPDRMLIGVMTYAFVRGGAWSFPGRTAAARARYLKRR